MNEWDEALVTLADNPADYEREGGTVLLTRHGEEVILELTDVPGGGLCVRKAPNELVPISTYIQREILALPRLARQIVSVSERAAEMKPVSFVEGPASVELDSTNTTWPAASVRLREFLQQAEPGTTRLIELMAPAGRGKTMLLETTSRAFALQYQPDPHPSPLLLKVDLLGRYVGTIDDAIAGSLNNEYYFPGLSQKDVALSVRRRWLILALDGFDELVARVGSRDAFLRITELLDQLEGQGTIILSAREAFFELYQVTTAIKTYLQPRRGNYTTSIIKLERWGPAQGAEVFEKLGSAKPTDDFQSLSLTFQGDEDLIYHPFFLTRLAQLWMNGERFVDAAEQNTGLARTRYVIETFVDREAREKWVDRDLNPLLPAIAHLHLLGGVAEEMWRSGAFALDPDELRLAAQLGVEHLGLAKAALDGALERIPTHAALTTKARKGTAFLHDRFLHYFLGFRIVHLLGTRDSVALRQLLSARELSPDAAEWIAWGWRNSAGNVRDAVNVLQDLTHSGDDATLRANVSDLVARLCDRQPGHGLSLHQLEFVGDSCRSRRYTDIEFVRCHFWQADLSGSTFTNCRFVDCEFGDLKLDDTTQFSGSRLSGGSFSSIESAEDRLFAPEAINDLLRERGMSIPVEQKAPAPTSSRVIPRDILKAVSTLIRASMKTWDVAVEDMEHAVGRPAVRDVIKAAQRHDILKEVNKATSGPHKRFVRFAVDREKLVQGEKGPIGDPRIDAFWSSLERK